MTRRAELACKQGIYIACGKANQDGDKDAQELVGGRGP
jgi:hypothetical protein